MPKPKILFLSGQEIFNELDKKRYFEASSSSVHTQYAFILKVNEQYTENQLEQIKNILNATDLNISPSLIFSPRLGTKSSWSSKCEDIFRNIGLKSIDRIERLYNSSRNEFDFHLSVIRKFIKLISIINQSIDYDIEFEEFEELALIINKKYDNMDHIKLIENIEKFISAIDGNANLRLSLMNMIINSNKALN